MRRTKDATNSPYKTTDTDTRDFPVSTGEPLLAADYAAVIDDIAAMMERIVALEAGGGGGGAGAEQTVGQFAIPAAQIQVIGGSSAVNRNGLCRWVKTGRQVTATIKAYIGGTSNTQIGIATAWLLAQGLPDPSVSLLSPASDFPRCVPAAAQLRGPSFGWETPLSAYADFDDETYFRLIRASAGNISEIHAVLSYIVD